LKANHENVISDAAVAAVLVGALIAAGVGTPPNPEYGELVD